MVHLLSVQFFLHYLDHLPRVQLLPCVIHVLLVHYESLVQCFRSRCKDFGRTNCRRGKH